METLNDLHGDLINLARVVQDQQLGPALYRKLRRTMFHEQLLDDSRRSLQGELHVFDRAYHYFVHSWMGRNGVGGTTSAAGQAFCLRFTSNGGSPSKRFSSAVDSIPAWSRRLRNVIILQRDAFELLGSIEDKAGTVIYLDPPYVTKGARYTHDFAGADHARLRDCITRFKQTRVVVSYYDHPTVRELYAGWTLVDCTMTKSLVSMGARAKDNDTKAPEVLIINGTSYTQIARGNP
jgi:DNA adenine methylase